MVGLFPASQRRPKSLIARKNAGQARAWCSQHQRCVGCESKSADRRPTDQNARNERRGDLRGRGTRGGAAAAIERAAVRRMVHGAVRDGVSSGVRTGAVRSAAGGAAAGNAEEERTAPPGGDATREVVRLRRRHTGPGSRACAPCPPDCP